jgi:hypothetical protein
MLKLRYKLDQYPYILVKIFKDRQSLSRYMDLINKRNAEIVEISEVCYGNCTDNGSTLRS